MFNPDKFAAANLNLREKTVDVSSLPDKFFDDPAKKVFKIRMVTGNELADCNEAVNLAKQTKNLISRMLSGTAKDKVDAICEASGLSEAMMPDTVRKLNVLKHALIEPVLPFDAIVRLQQFYPLVFNELANEAILLTGLGADAGE